MPRASATPERRNARSRLPGLKNQPAGRPEAAVLRSVRALDRRVEGYSYRAIGGALGVNAGTAYRDVERALAEALDRRDDLAERARTLELRRCDRYLRALAPKIAGGDEGAINTALRIGARRARLLGLDLQRDPVQAPADPEAALAALTAATGSHGNGQDRVYDA